jgi:glutamyl-tRNA reductase
VGGKARPYADLDRLLGLSDVVISSTGSTEPIVTRARMKSIMKARRHRPVFIVDIAVPRDVEPSCGKLDGVYLFDIDDLEKVVADNLKERHREADGAERIVETEVGQFVAWLRGQGVVPTIKDLRERFTRIVTREIEETLSSLDPQVRQAAEEGIRRMADAIVSKLLHDPFMALRHGDSQEVEQLVAATRRLFALELERPKAAGGKG